jgi:hypothetical protein
MSTERRKSTNKLTEHCKRFNQLLFKGRLTCKEIKILFERDY